MVKFKKCDWGGWGIIGPAKEVIKGRYVKARRKCDGNEVSVKVTRVTWTNGFVSMAFFKQGQRPRYQTEYKNCHYCGQVNKTLGQPYDDLVMLGWGIVTNEKNEKCVWARICSECRERRDEDGIRYARDREYLEQEAD